MSFFEDFWREAGQGRWISAMSAEAMRLALLFSLHARSDGRISPGLEAQAPAKLGEGKYQSGVAELQCFEFLTREKEGDPFWLRTPGPLTSEESALMTPTLRGLLVDLYRGQRDFDLRSLEGIVFKERLSSYRKFGEEKLGWREVLSGIRKEIDRVPVPPATKESLFTKMAFEAIKSYEELTGNPLYWDEVDLVREALKVCTPASLRKNMERIYARFPEPFKSVGFRYVHPMAVNGAFGRKKPLGRKPKERAEQTDNRKEGGNGNASGWRESFL